MCRKPSRLNKEALRFLLEQWAWLVRVARYILKSFRLQDSTEDIMQILAVKCLGISDEKWGQIPNKKAYLAKAIRNQVIDLCKEHSLRNRPLPMCPDPFTSIEAMEAGRLVQQLLPKLSPDEATLLELLFEERSADEIAEILGITSAAARQRSSRLRKKMRLLR